MRADRVMAITTTISKEIPGSEWDRAGAKYFNFDWHQSHDKISNFQMDAQAN